MMLKAINIITLLAMSVFAGYQWSDANHANKVNALNAQITKLSNELQKAADEKGELNRNLKVANQERIHAVETKDHANRTVQRLQDMLNRAKTTGR